jgi:ParB family chromosome partitioning protein
MSNKDKPRLGRGLQGLISSPPVAVNAAGAPAGVPAGVAGERLQYIEILSIDPNPHQPRARINQIALDELTASIKASGVLQPVIVRPVGNRYQLIAGHRRTMGARLAGLSKIPAMIRADATDEQQAEWALVENIRRDDLNAMERAQAYKAYIERFGVTHAQAAERLGEDRAVITNFLRLLELNPGVQDLVARGILSAGHAKVLVGVTDAARQDLLANQTVSEGLSVRRLEELVNVVLAAPAGGVVEVAGHTRALTAKSPHVVELEQQLSHKLGTKVRIFPSKKKNTGKIVIQYFSLDEFDRMVEKFG